MTSPSAHDRRDVVTVRRRTTVAQGVVELELARPDGSRLPDWTPGSHIDLLFDDGLVRQYSLCGDRWDPGCYRIAVQHEFDGRGGSKRIHEELREGVALRFGGPRNNFRIPPATEYLFVAGGIGITPILPMIAHAQRMGADWNLLYLGRSKPRMAYLSELARFGDRVRIHASDESGRFNLASMQPRDPAVRVLACGPSRLLEAVEAWGAREGGWPPIIEHFAADAHVSRPSNAFEVIAERSGKQVKVAADESVVSALHRIGVPLLTSCGQGICGTCETRVIAGSIDHRDTLLTDRERAAGDVMFPCVSRCAGQQLVLDL